MPSVDENHIYCVICVTFNARVFLTSNLFLQQRIKRSSQKGRALLQDSNLIYYTDSRTIRILCIKITALFFAYNAFRFRGWKSEDLKFEISLLLTGAGVLLLSADYVLSRLACQR
jgi:hypothetical protein